MFAVIFTGGKQYVVQTGAVLKVEKLKAEVGEKITFDKVLLTADDDGGNVKVGAPYVADAAVAGVVTEQGKSRTLRVQKYKRKVRYSKVHGQRQRYTAVKIV